METITGTPERSLQGDTTSRKPFSSIDGTVSLLFLDDQKIILDLLEETFKPLKVYSLFKARTAREAMTLFQKKRIHTCIMDLGICDVEDDEFSLLKNFGSRVAFVVLTGSQYPSKGFDSYRLGAKAVIEKTAAFESDSLIATVNRCTLCNLVNPNYNEHDNSTIALSTRMLFEHSPSTVTEWAQSINLTDRQLRKCWKIHPHLNARSALFIYHLYNQTFLYYENLQKISEKHILSQNLTEIRKLEEYYMLHKSTIMKHLS